MEILIACTVLVLIIIAIIIAYVFKKMDYGFFQSLVLGLLTVIPFVASIILELLDWVVVKSKDLALILGGTDYGEMTKRWLEMSKNEES